jgi:hypothetical protein
MGPLRLEYAKVKNQGREESSLGVLFGGFF